jgi:hypothetical protein
VSRIRPDDCHVDLEHLRRNGRNGVEERSTRPKKVALVMSLGVRFAVPSPRRLPGKATYGESQIQVQASAAVVPS